jgi:peptidoglycan-associated lipoprotein
MRTALTLVAFPCLGLILACGGATPPAAAPSVASSSAPMMSPETPTQAASSGAVQVSIDILKACGLSDADAYFPFDSAHLEKQDIGPLNTIAICFTTGKLKGRPMKLVGHADPRGATDYNMTLGQFRADGVEVYLEKRGLDKTKMESSSRGALDATGTDEAGWAHDRRVDLTLGS